MANDSQSIAHTKWKCKNHIVYAPKNRGKIRMETENRHR